MFTFFALNNVLIVLATIVAAFVVAYLLGIYRYIGNNRVGVVEKLWSSNGSLKSGIVALKGEAGFEAELLRGGLHFFMPLQYRVHSLPLVTIPQGKIGYVFARDGKPLEAT